MSLVVYLGIQKMMTGIGRREKEAVMESSGYCSNWSLPKTTKHLSLLWKCDKCRELQSAFLTCWHLYSCASRSLVLAKWKGKAVIDVASTSEAVVPPRKEGHSVWIGVQLLFFNSFSVTQLVRTLTSWESKIHWYVNIHACIFVHTCIYIFPVTHLPTAKSLHVDKLPPKA